MSSRILRDLENHELRAFLINLLDIYLLLDCLEFLSIIIILNFDYILLIRCLFTECLNRHFVLREYYYDVYIPIFTRVMSAIS
jgi:hypothetical protein